MEVVAMRGFSWLAGTALVVGGTGMAVLLLGNLEVQRLAARVDELEREKTQLIEYARRLSASRRVAQVEIIRQQPDDRGRTLTTLLWQEIGPSGALGRPQAVETFGTQIYFEALVIKFEPELVGQGDAARGTSLALFRRIFGDQQPPETGAEVDRSSRPPLTDPRASDPLHDRLWSRFWEMVDDPRVAGQFGVRVAQCEAPSVPVRTGQVWEVSLDAAGGLNLRRIGMRSAEALGKPVSNGRGG
jgi:hypothetical protein